MSVQLIRRGVGTISNGSSSDIDSDYFPFFSGGLGNVKRGAKDGTDSSLLMHLARCISLGILVTPLHG